MCIGSQVSITAQYVFCSVDFSHLPDYEFLQDRDGLLLPLWSQFLTQQIKLDGWIAARIHGWMEEERLDL